MKSLTRLWLVLAQELGSRCSVDVTHDIKTVECRVEHEGLSLFTIAMPDLCSFFESCLEEGYMDASLLPGWKTGKGRKIPAFLQGFFCLVFDRETGRILGNSSRQSDAVFAIRQLLLLYKKMKMDPTERRIQAAIAGYVSCEQELKEGEKTVRLGTLPQTFAWLFSTILNTLTREIDNFELNPKHGPGATADKKKGNKKFLFDRWTWRLESVFPSSEYAVPNYRYFNGDNLAFDTPEQELPVKVVFVPKTQKAPRIIAEEPSYIQYCQQAIACRLKDLISQSDLVGPMMDMNDQTRNRELARLGSITGRLSTIDLSEASDRVLNSTVVALFKPWPSVLEAIQATRSRRALLPNGQTVRLSKFASMGSALCFPVETMVFLTIVVDACLRGGDVTRISEHDIKSLHGSVSVYGDDIIVPSYTATDVMKLLQDNLLKVNTSKSFIHGPFKESCGGDYFYGFNVTPIKVRRLPSSHLTDEDFVSLCATRNQFYWHGLWQTAGWMDEYLHAQRRAYTIVPRKSNGVGRESVLLSSEDKWNNRLQMFETLCLVDIAKAPENKISGAAALHKCLAGDFKDPLYDGHLLRSGRTSSVNLKRKGVPAG
ncbi:TPA_asm: RNA-directed RNA polymerase [ssRNA phage SRR7976323_5]|uniref:RNA-directed RNA polymerase n=1 Tax=ssRNA phage SRR7976323_5 TaxID=2786692 RepID=A0A8S5L143_9VIRU|nr:RNA-directed RNA polymerase [ssRNA phage SRR7976323_5]DAD51159.1 TPA_asm: RNA-directed RNA polymerase [ssRNA phage SRR7976323_5]